MWARAGRYICFAVPTLLAHVIIVTKVSGVSMIPTLTGNNEWVVTERVSLLRGDVRVGDVVVAASKTSPGDTVVKRVLALPGESVRVRSLRDGGFRVEQVPAGHVWLQGDNFHSSQDSRDYGAMPWAMLQGRVFAVVRAALCFGQLWCIMYPLNRFCQLEPVGGLGATYRRRYVLANRSGRGCRSIATVFAVFAVSHSFGTPHVFLHIMMVLLRHCNGITVVLSLLIVIKYLASSSDSGLYSTQAFRHSVR